MRLMNIWKCVTVGSVYQDLEFCLQWDFLHCSHPGLQEHWSFQVWWTSCSACKITIQKSQLTSTATCQLLLLFTSKNIHQWGRPRWSPTELNAAYDAGPMIQCRRTLCQTTHNLSLMYSLELFGLLHFFRPQYKKRSLGYSKLRAIYVSYHKN